MKFSPVFQCIDFYNEFITSDEFVVWVKPLISTKAGDKKHTITEYWMSCSPTIKYQYLAQIYYAFHLQKQSTILQNRFPIFNLVISGKLQDKVFIIY